MALLGVAAAIAYALLAPGANQPPSQTGNSLARVAGSPSPATSPLPATRTTQTQPTPATGTTQASAAPTASTKAPAIPAVTPTPAPVTAPPASKAAPTSATPTATAPKATATTPAATPAPGTTTTAATQAADTAPAAIPLSAGSITTYNPFGAPAASLGSPARAIDGNPLTSWTYRLDASAAGRTMVGLMISLNTPRQVRAITLATATPGMSVEFYGATGSPPASITDPGWLHLTSRPSIAASATVTLPNVGKKLDCLLIWVTAAPPGVTVGSLGISELSVRG
jgi:hypothetical protein